MGRKMNVANNVVNSLYNDNPWIALGMGRQPFSSATAIKPGKTRGGRTRRICPTCPRR